MANPPRRRTTPGIARVAFIAHVAVIRSELEQGWSAKAIYQRHADKFTAISYPQFVRYVRQLKSGTAPGEANKAVYAPASGRFVDPAAPQPDPIAAGRSPAPREPAVQARPQPTAKESGTPRETSDRPRQFVWNPMPNKDELI